MNFTNAKLPRAKTRACQGPQPAEDMAQTPGVASAAQGAATGSGDGVWWWSVLATGMPLSPLSGAL
jgi:hypothetical protein